jgi:hypothetical protein
MIQYNQKDETLRKQNLSSARIEAMRKKAIQMDARPVSPDAVKLAKCGEYYVGCNTITAKM